MRSTLSTPHEIWQQQFKQRITSVLNTHIAQGATLYLGCSGGMDSMLLLHLFANIVPQQLHVITVDHQLQSASQQWSEFVATQCNHYSVKCSIVPVEVQSGNLEAAARQARYKAFEEFIQPNDVLVLAHHAQDQAETVLLRLLQGTGVGGLSAMQTLESRKTCLDNKPYQLWRPFLDVSKEQITQSITELNLQYVDDPMNHDVDYDRVWCREQLWPMLQERFPKMQEAIGRCAVLMQDADEILQEVLCSDLQASMLDEIRLDLDVLLQLSMPRQRQLLSVWMQADNPYRPPFSMVDRLKSEVILAKPDAVSVLHYAGYYFTRFGRHLYRYTEQQWQSFHQPLVAHSFSICHDHILNIASGNFKLEKSDLGLDYTLLQKELTVCSRRGGEKIELYGRGVHRPLKKIIQDAKIAPWDRHQIQILMYHNTILGVFTCKGFWLAQNPYCVEHGWLPKLNTE